MTKAGPVLFILDTIEARRPAGDFMSQSSLRTLLTVAALLVPSLAMAHTGQGEAFGFAHGFAHPMGGIDHVLAMILVGVLAGQLGGRALWLVPASFVSVMALGGGAGLAGIGLPFVELGIAMSVVVLGATVALGVSTPVFATMGLAGFFAIFHGYAHGAEMPDIAGLDYGAGFMAATALLHALGAGGALLAGRPAASRGASLLRCMGGVASIAGIGILTGNL